MATAGWQDAFYFFQIPKVCNEIILLVLCLVDLEVCILKYGLLDFVVCFPLDSVSKRYDRHL